MKSKPTIEELEAILASKEPLRVEIQPDGSILAVPIGNEISEQDRFEAFNYAVELAIHEYIDRGKPQDRLRTAAAIGALKVHLDHVSMNGLPWPGSDQLY